MEASDSSEPRPGSDQRHPRGLYSLFFTEMWERFCYYGMRALLVLFLIQYHGWQPGHASTIYKWYTSLVYLTPLAGGLLADRVIGLRNSIVVGGVLMAIGEVSLTFAAMPMFYLGLGLLIVGNGFFKPNISTIVGKMYGPGDARRDRGFTIFYMGINLGAGLAPIVCGYLREHYGFRYGFAVAAVGMLVALAVFLATQHQVLRDVEAAGNDLRVAARRPAGDARGAGSRSSSAVAVDVEVSAATGGAGAFAKAYLVFMLVVAVALPADYVWRAASGTASWTDVIMPVAFGAISGWMALTLRRIEGAARDKSIVIFVFFVFAVLFWMAVEQAGNALNLWAQFHTELSIGGFHYPAEWWQTVNAVLIVAFAPAFARAWTWLGERGREPSTPMKMFAAMVLMALSFLAMVAGAKVENGVATTQELASVPAEVPAAPRADGRVVIGDDDAGRLTFDPAAHALEARGVLPRYVTSDLLRRTVPASFAAEVASLEAQTRKATPETPVRVAFAAVPAGFAFPFDGAEAADRGVAWDASTSTMTFTRWMEAPTLADLTSGGAPPAWRDALFALEKKSDAARVSGIWLLLSYLFATLGELCLSPVGLSMVTKLAPARFASLFMGVWLLASSVAQYAGGSIGETWGIIPPADYFMVFVWTSIGGAVVLALLVRPLKRLMHDVT
jgi:POT family proton-dependent oligopeptide transporter